MRRLKSTSCLRDHGDQGTRYLSVGTIGRKLLLQVDTDLGQQMPSKTHLSMVIQVLECISVLGRYKGIGTYLLAAVPPSETSSTYKKLHNPSS